MIEPRLKEQYKKKIVIDLQKKFSMKNKLMVPKFLKVVLNMGLGEDAKDKKKFQQEEHKKIKEYGESINEETRNKNN